MNSRKSNKIDKSLARLSEKKEVHKKIILEKKFLKDLTTNAVVKQQK